MLFLVLLICEAIIVGTSLNFQNKVYSARTTYCWNIKSCLGLHANHHGSWFFFLKSPVAIPENSFFTPYLEFMRKFTSQLVLFLVAGYNKQKQKSQFGVHFSWNPN